MVGFSDFPIRAYRYATWSEVEALASALKVDPYWLANRQCPASVVPRAPAIVRRAAGVATAKPAHVAARVAPIPAASAPTPAPVLAPAEIPALVPGAEAKFRRQMTEALARTLAKLGDPRLKPFEWHSWRKHDRMIRAGAVSLMALPD